MERPFVVALRHERSYYNPASCLFQLGGRCRPSDCWGIPVRANHWKNQTAELQGEDRSVACTWLIALRPCGHACEVGVTHSLRGIGLWSRCVITTRSHWSGGEMASAHLTTCLRGVKPSIVRQRGFSREGAATRWPKLSNLRCLRWRRPGCFRAPCRSCRASPSSAACG